MAVVGRAAVAAVAQAQGGRVRLPPGRAPRAGVRAGRGAAGRARLRGVGAVHRPQHRELVRRPRRSRARRRPQSRPQRARLSEAGDGQQGEPDRADARRRRTGQRVDAPQSRGRAGGRLRGRAVFVDRRRARGRRRRRVDGAAGAAARGGAAAGAPAADHRHAGADAGRRVRAAARRGSGQHRRPAGAAQGAAGHRARAEGARPGFRDGALRVGRLPEDLALAPGLEATLCADAHVDAAARAHLRARPRRRAVGAILGAARTAGGGHARRRAGRFHAPPARDLARRARRADRIVQHDDDPAAGGAAEDRGVAPRHRDDARVPREHSRQPVRGRARVRRWLPAAHGECERGGDPAAAARRAHGPAARRLGAQASGAGSVRGARRRRLSRERRRALAEAGGALGVQSDAHAAHARLAAAGDAGGRLRRRVRRRHRPRPGAARRGVGRGRAPARARDQESADADPAVGRAARTQARAEALRRRTRRRCRAARRRSSRRWRR